MENCFKARTISHKKGVAYFCGKKDTIQIIKNSLQKGIDLNSPIIKVNGDSGQYILLEDLQKLLDFILVTPNKK